MSLVPWMDCIRLGCSLPVIAYSMLQVEKPTLTVHQDTHLGPRCIPSFDLQHLK